MATISSPRFPVRYSCSKAAQLLGLVFLLGGTGACRLNRSTPVDLSFQVKPSGQLGVYQLTGVTNLPERSRLSLLAVRYLQPSTDATPIQPAEANYAILARDTAEVAQGQWKTTLNLWQSWPSKRYQESWQLEYPKLALSLRASSQVMFIAIFEPDNQPQLVKDQLKQKELRSPLLRFTPSGQQYLQVSQSLPVSLSLETPQPLTTTNDLNNGWGNRSVVKSTSAFGQVVAAPPREKQLDSPLSPANFLR